MAARKAKPMLHDNGTFDDFTDWRDCPVPLYIDEHLMAMVKQCMNGRHGTAEHPGQRIQMFLDNAVREHAKYLRRQTAHWKNENKETDEAWERYKASHPEVE